VRGQSFEESPAIIRTAEGMAAIRELEQSLDAVLSTPGPSSQVEALNALLRSHIGESDSDADGETDSDIEGMALDGVTGDKRKLFVFIRGFVGTFTANNPISETVCMTPECVSVRVSRCLMLRRPSSSGGMHNHPMYSSRILSRLFRLSRPPVPLPRPPCRNRKINLPVPQRQRGEKSAHQGLPHHARVHC
jgi:hypothetical protein